MNNELRTNNEFRMAQRSCARWGASIFRKGASMTARILVVDDILPNVRLLEARLDRRIF